MHAIFFAALLAAAVAGSGVAFAQATPEQQSAIKANCRSDFMANCMGVPRGGREALQCLQSNLAKLSSGCKQAVSAIGAKPAAPAAAAAKPAAPAAAPAPASAATAPAPAPVEATAPAAAAPQAATAPQQKASPAQAPAKAATPAPAKAATPAASAPKATAKTEPAAPPPSAPQPAAAPPPGAAPSVIVVAPRRIFALVRTKCRADYRAHCSDVDIGGGRVVACLQANAASLSPACREGLAALGR